MNELTNFIKAFYSIINNYVFVVEDLEGDNLPVFVLVNPPIFARCVLT